MIKIRWWIFILVLLASSLIGSCVGRLLPPFVLDDTFWKQFWAGPPAAGIFALFGAIIAFGAAWLGNATTRKASKRQEWWDRAEWALKLATSDKDTDRIIGLQALMALSPEASETEYELILAVTGAVSGDGIENTEADEDVDSPSQLEENVRKGGVFQWLRNLCR